MHCKHFLIFKWLWQNTRLETKMKIAQSLLFSLTLFSFSKITCLLFLFCISSGSHQWIQAMSHLLKLLCNKHFLLMPNSFILPGKCCYPFVVNVTTNIAFCFSFFSVLHISFSSSEEVILYLTALVEQKCMHLWLPVLYVHLSLLSILNLHLFQYTLYFF